MTEITYNLIKPIIKKEELINGNQINIEFCASNQETATQTVAVIVPEQNEIMKKATKDVIKSAVKSTLISQVLRFLGIGGIGGSIIRTTTNNVVNNNSTNFMATKVTQEKKEKAIVDAFKGIMSAYQFNEQKSEWFFVQ